MPVFLGDLRYYRVFVVVGGVVHVQQVLCVLIIIYEHHELSFSLFLMIALNFLRWQFSPALFLLVYLITFGGS